MPRERPAIPPLRDGISRRVQPMALELLDRLASRIPQRAGAGAGADAAPDRAHLQKLLAAVVQPGRHASIAAVADLAAAGLSPGEIADRHVPAVATALGAGWERDADSFTTVTVGGARLQWLVRMLDRDIPAAAAGQAAHAVLLLTVAGADHTLGAVLLASQMRRRGLGVRLMLGAQPHGVALALRKSAFDAVMISAAPGDSATELAALVRMVRAEGEGGAKLPVVLGGGILATDPEAATRIGADFATSDLDAALAHCGIADRVGMKISA